MKTLEFNDDACVLVIEADGAIEIITPPFPEDIAPGTEMPAGLEAMALILTFLGGNSDEAEPELRDAFDAVVDVTRNRIATEEDNLEEAA